VVVGDFNLNFGTIAIRHGRKPRRVELTEAGLTFSARFVPTGPAGVPLELIANNLGHSDLRMARLHYVNL